MKDISKAICVRRDAVSKTKEKRTHLEQVHTEGCSFDLNFGLQQDVLRHTTYAV